MHAAVTVQAVNVSSLRLHRQQRLQMTASQLLLPPAKEFDLPDSVLANTWLRPITIGPILICTKANVKANFCALFVLLICLCRAI